MMTDKVKDHQIKKKMKMKCKLLVKDEVKKTKRSGDLL